MNKQKFVMKMRYKMYDILLATIMDIGNQYTISHSSNYEQIWVYKDFPGGYYIITFPVDLLYINIFKNSCQDFYNYIKNKLEKYEYEKENE